MDIERTLTETISEDCTALHLDGEILGTVRKLTDMELCNVLRSGFTRLPASRSNLANLTTLNLNNNKLSQFPEVVLYLMNLTHLFVNDNHLSTLPANLNYLGKLQELELRNNKLKYIIDLHNLKKLSVTGNPLIFQEMRGLMMLMDLNSQRMLIDIAS